MKFMTHFQMHPLNPQVILGVFIGLMMSFVVCGLTINAVGRAATSMVEEVRRQFKEKPGILKGTDKPDCARCFAISTLGAQREMILPPLRPDSRGFRERPVPRTLFAADKTARGDDDRLRKSSNLLVFLKQALQPVLHRHLGDR